MFHDQHHFPVQRQFTLASGSGSGSNAGTSNSQRNRMDGQGYGQNGGSVAISLQMLSHLLDSRWQHPLFQSQRWNQRTRIVEERWNGFRHGDGQGYPQRKWQNDGQYSQLPRSHWQHPHRYSMIPTYRRTTEPNFQHGRWCTNCGRWR